jgi:hypothetical protein
MSNEASIRVGLQIRAGNIDYASRPTSFRANVTGRKGPVPGAITVTTAGIDVDFSGLTTPGLATIHNLDATNYVTCGIYEPSNGRFYPVHEILPGEIYPCRFSRALLDYVFPATGTGTSAPSVTFRIKADTASCVVVVEAFER